MLEKTILIDNMEHVKQFVEIAASKEYEITLSSDNRCVDAKSIIGVFSLDLTKPVLMIAKCDLVADLSRQITPFIYKEKHKP